MENVREAIRQWLLILAQAFGIIGVVYETFWDHIEKPHLLALFALMIGVSQAESGLGLVRKLLAFRADGKIGSLKVGVGTLPPEAEGTSDSAQSPVSTKVPPSNIT